MRRPAQEWHACPQRTERMHELGRLSIDRQPLVCPRPHHCRPTLPRGGLSMFRRQGAAECLAICATSVELWRALGTIPPLLEPFIRLSVIEREAYTSSLPVWH